MVDALATRADEGRGYAAISSGELLTGRSGDLRMGQPLFRDGRRLA
jgi:arginine deiminase